MKTIRTRFPSLLPVLLVAVLVGCQRSGSESADAGDGGADATDAEVTDGGATDGAATDGAATDGGATDDTEQTDGSDQAETNKVKTDNWGTASGQDVFLYTLTNANGMVCKLTNWGATITELHVKDRDGNIKDVVLGFESLERWLDSDGEGNPNPSYMGCTVGRYCNRIGGGQFELDGQKYQLAQNNNENHLHGGDKGWDKKVWKGEVLEDKDGAAVRFTVTSPDGDENYPGQVQAEVVYLLTDDDTLRIEFSAMTDIATPLSMTNHSYFNLSGEGNGTILDHELKLAASQQTVFDDQGISTGEIAAVEGTPLDFVEATRIGERIDQIGGDPGGYDHNFVLRDEKIAEPELAATVYDPASGRVLEISTTEVGIQFYSGNYLDGSLTGKSGKVYEKNYGLCLEPQFHPDSPNQPDFPSCILQPGQRYSQISEYKFSVRD